MLQPCSLPLTSMPKSSYLYCPAGKHEGTKRLGLQECKDLLGTHCRGGSHRLVLEVGTLCKEVSAGCLCCTVSGHRLPWLRRTDQEGHVVEVWWKKRWLSLPGWPSISPHRCWDQHLFPLDIMLSRVKVTLTHTASPFALFPLGTKKMCLPSSVQSDSTMGQSSI